MVAPGFYLINKFFSGAKDFFLHLEKYCCLCLCIWNTYIHIYIWIPYIKYELAEMKEYPLIISSLLIFLAMVQRMVIENDGLSHLDLLLQKSLRYKHHSEYLIYIHIKMYTWTLIICIKWNTQTCIKWLPINCVLSY